MTDQTAEYPYHYFVSYSWTWGNGSGDISLAEPVRGWSDIALLGKLATQSVRREHPNVEVGEVVILNYQLMSGPEHGKAEQALVAPDARERLARHLYTTALGENLRRSGEEEWDTGQANPEGVQASYRRADEIIAVIAGSE